jgi:hypothetical protein
VSDGAPELSPCEDHRSKGLVESPRKHLSSQPRALIQCEDRYAENMGRIL